MSGKRQNNQLRLAFSGEQRSEAPMAPGGGSETPTAERMFESPASNHEQLMEEVCAHDNCVQAFKRVKSNKGSPGIDGMTVEQLPGHLKEHWPAIREQLQIGGLRARQLRAGLQASEVQQGQSGHRRHDGRAVAWTLEGALASHPRTTSCRDLQAATGEAGRDT